MTNFEKIKSMSVDEMVAFLRDANCYTTCLYMLDCEGEMNCNNGIKKWLQNKAP